MLTFRIRPAVRVWMLCVLGRVLYFRLRWFSFFYCIDLKPRTHCAECGNPIQRSPSELSNITSTYWRRSELSHRWKCCKNEKCQGCFHNDVLSSAGCLKRGFCVTSFVVFAFIFLTRDESNRSVLFSCIRFQLWPPLKKKKKSWRLILLWLKTACF